MLRRGSERTITRQPINTPSPARSINGRSGWVLTISTASWAARPTSGRRISSRTTSRFFRGSASRLQPHHRSGGRGDQLLEGAQFRGSRQAVLPLLRSRGSHSPHQPKAEWVEKFKGKFDMAGMPCATKSSPTRNALASFRQCEADRMARYSAEVEALSADQKKLFARQAGRSMRATPPTLTTRSAA